MTLMKLLGVLVGPLTCRIIQDAPAYSFSKQGERVHTEAKVPRRTTYLYRARAGGTEANREFHAYLPKWSCLDRWRPSPAGKHCHFQWLLHRSDPAALALLADTLYVRLLNERARAFMRSATASPWGWYGEAALLSIHLFPFTIFLFPLSPSDPRRKRSYIVLGVVRNPAATLIRMGRTFHCVRTH